MIIYNLTKNILKENGYQINEMIGPFMLQDYIAIFTNSDSGKTIEKKVKAFHLVNAAELASKYRSKNEDLSLDAEINEAITGLKIKKSNINSTINIDKTIKEDYLNRLKYRSELISFLKK